MDAQGRHGPASPQVDWALAVLDARLAPIQACFREIVAAHGWPRRSVVANDGANAAWLLVQHDSAHQAAHLPLMIAAAERGEASWADVSFLGDRVRYNQGQPQLYGTQAICDAATGTLRPAVGLGPLAEHLPQIPGICKRSDPGPQP